MAQFNECRDALIKLIAHGASKDQALSIEVERLVSDGLCEELARPLAESTLEQITKYIIL